MDEVFPLSLQWHQVILLVKKNTVFCAQADMWDQEAAFVQIQEAKTMVEEDLQRRLEEFEDEKEQLQKVAASAASLEQRLEQASTGRGLARRPHCARLCWGVRRIRYAVISSVGLLLRAWLGVDFCWYSSTPELSIWHTDPKASR